MIMTMAHAVRRPEIVSAAGGEDGSGMSDTRMSAQESLHRMQRTAQLPMTRM